MTQRAEDMTQTTILDDCRHKAPTTARPSAGFFIPAIRSSVRLDPAAPALPRPYETPLRSMS